jgi:hypothetical protein
MTEGKQIAYFYDKILAEEETELDVDGSVVVPAKGDTRQHGGKTWTVEHVGIDRTVRGYCIGAFPLNASIQRVERCSQALQTLQRRQWLSAL